MTLKYGNLDNSYTDSCPSHCQNCKYLSVACENNSFSDGLGGVTSDYISYNCDRLDAPCPENKVDCPSVNLPRFCRNCAECTDCVFLENEEPLVDLVQYNHCLVDGMDDYLVENVAV
jgi:hypothetical protein